MSELTVQYLVLERRDPARTLESWLRRKNRRGYVQRQSG